MNCIPTKANEQLSLTQTSSFLRIPSCLSGFINQSTDTLTAKSGRTVIRFNGVLHTDDEGFICARYRL